MILLALSRSGLWTQAFFRAIDQRLLFSGSKCGVRVQWKIEPRWHVPFFHLLRDVFGVPLRKVPLGKVQMAAPFVYIPLD